MAFQGSLKELPLPDIIQLVSVSGKSGVFSIEDDGNVGRIVLRDGQIVDAEVGEVRGEEAVYELSIWPQGQFQFEPNDTSDQTATIDKSNTNLLLEAARRMDEWKILSRRVASTRLIPTITRSDAGSELSLNPGERMVVEKIDSRRTIESIGLELGQSPFEVAKIVFGLITSGIVELRDAEAWLSAEKLDRLSAEQLTSVADRVFEEAFERLQGDAALLELDRLYSDLKESSQATPRDLQRLVRGTRRLVASELGSDDAVDFFARVANLAEEV